MKKSFQFLYIFWWLSISTNLQAKGKGADIDWEALYTHRTEEKIPYEVFQEQLIERQAVPLNLNQVSREVLQELCILTDEQLEHFFRHISQHGPLLSIYELQAIPTWNLSTIRQILPFVYLSKPHHLPHRQVLGQRIGYSWVRYERTLEPQKGYLPTTKNPYLGSPHGLYNRLNINHPDGWALGWSLRKKPGEAWNWAPAAQGYGLSLVRGHIALKHQKSLKMLVLGDYAVGYGEGLVLNAGFSTKKGAETVQVMRTNNTGLRAHTAWSEAAFRGVAFTLDRQPIEWTVYGSRVLLDAKVHKDKKTGKQYAETFKRGGEYRKATDLAKQGTVTEHMVGTTFVYKATKPGAMVGGNLLCNQYSLPIYPDLRKGNPLRFSGQEHANRSLFGRYLWRNFHFFGERALSTHGAPAGLVGVIASLTSTTDTTLLFRHYSQDFHAPYGKAFRENSSSNSNERGVYVGVTLRPWHRWYLDAFYDYFYMPWFEERPSDGHQWRVKATHRPDRDSMAYLQYQGKQKAKRIPKTEDITAGTKNQLKLHYHRQVGRKFRWTTELQGSTYSWRQQRSWGVAGAQQMGYTLRKVRLKGNIVGFCIQDDINKLSFYEPNVQHTGFNFSTYRGQGFHSGVLIVYRPINALRIELKGTLIYYFNKEKIGKNAEEIDGNLKRGIRVQATYSL